MISAPLPKDEQTISREFPALKARQPIGDIFVASIDFELIQQVTFFDVRRRLQQDRDVEKYLGIQRPLRDNRVEDLMDYVNYLDATFPTSIIVAIEADYVEYDDVRGMMRISNTRKGEDKPDTAFRNLCRVIDGQHRIAGLKGFRGKNFDLIVSIFVGSDISDQAYVFATVNLEQTKVNKSLAIDLFDLAKTRSPAKTCHNIAVALDQAEGSPFYKRIKRLGVATEGRTGETITQATFVNSLLDYISDDAKQDRDALLRGGTLAFVSGPEDRRLCFRNMFIREKDVEIGKIVENYFLAVQERWRDAWTHGGTGLILNRTNGFRALMRLLGRSYNYLALPGQSVSKEKFLDLFERVNVGDDYFSVERFRPGSSGEAQLRNFLSESMFGD